MLDALRFTHSSNWLKLLESATHIQVVQCCHFVGISWSIRAILKNRTRIYRIILLLTFLCLLNDYSSFVQIATIAQIIFPFLNIETCNKAVILDHIL